MPVPGSVLADQLRPVVEGLGARIVELHSSVIRGRTHVNLVVYRPEGVSIDDCARIHRTVIPRLELVLGNRDVALQVASPGIDRTLKENAEFAVFEGRGVRVLCHGSEEWLAGIIGNVDAAGFDIVCTDGVRRVPYERVQKAKLDYTQEVR